MALKYRTILIDPPWDNADAITPRDSFQSYEGGWPYPTMRLADIAKIPVGDLADTKCQLYLWTMTAFMPHAFWLMQHWGFNYSNVITWVKPSGTGYWWINRTQMMIWGYRGGLEMKTKHLPNVFGAPAVKHSQKPDISYELIEQVSHGPYVELFARRPRPGWHVWGNEVKSDLEITT